MDSRRNRQWSDMDNSNIELSVLIQHFEVHNRTEGKSPRTVGWYNEVLGLFLKWLKEKRMPTNLGAIGEMEVRQFILHLQGKPGVKGVMSTHYIWTCTSRRCRRSSGASGSPGCAWPSESPGP
jgi:hypothetical protein